MKKAIETIYTESLRLTLQNQLSTMTEFLPVWEHQVRVTALAGTLARELRLDVKKVKLAAALHDLGKFTWPRELFYKPNKFLTEKDWNIIFAHPRKNVEIIEEFNGHSSYLSTGNPSVCDIILFHHEKPDGNGYYRITDLPPETVILSVADIFEACSSNRSYRVALPARVAIELAVKDFKDYLGNNVKLIKDILHTSIQSSSWKKKPSKKK